MSYRIAFDATHHLAMACFAGTVDGKEMVEASTATLQGAAPGDLDIVWDASAMKALHLMPGDIERILEAKQHPPPGVVIRRHVFVAHRPLDLLVARLYATLAGRCGIKVHVCGTREEAEKTLGRCDLPVLSTSSFPN